MADLKSGVAKYIYGSATVATSFPVDHKGSMDLSCKQCDFFRRNYRRCGLNNAIVEYPDTNIGSKCPLTFYTEDEEGGMHEWQD